MIKYALIALACAGGLSTAALAASDDIDVSVIDGFSRSARVDVSDLDLTRAKGKVALRARLKHAVEQVCAADAACAYTAERDSAREAGRAIAAANGQLAMATPSHLTVGAR